MMLSKLIVPVMMSMSSWIKLRYIRISYFVHNTQKHENLFRYRLSMEIDKWNHGIQRVHFGLTFLKECWRNLPLFLSCMLYFCQIAKCSLAPQLQHNQMYTLSQDQHAFYQQYLEREISVRSNHQSKVILINQDS